MLNGDISNDGVTINILVIVQPGSRRSKQIKQKNKIADQLWDTPPKTWHKQAVCCKKQAVEEHLLYANTALEQKKTTQHGE